MTRPAIQRRFTSYSDTRRCYGFDTSPAPFDPRPAEQRPKPAAIRAADVIAREPDPVVRADATAELSDHMPLHTMAVYDSGSHDADPCNRNIIDMNETLDAIESIGHFLLKWLVYPAIALVLVFAYFKGWLA